MEDSRSALNNQRLNVTRRKQGTRPVLAWKNEHWWVSRRLKKVTLCSRIPLVKAAEGACHQRSTEIPGERHTVTAAPQTAFPFDRNSYLVRARVDKISTFLSYPAMLRYCGSQTTVVYKQRVAGPDRSALMAVISKKDGLIATSCVNISRQQGY